MSKKKRKDPKKWAKKWLRSGWKVKNTDQRVNMDKYAKNYDLINWGYCTCKNPVIIVKNHVLYCNICKKRINPKDK